MEIILQRYLFSVKELFLRLRYCDKMHQFTTILPSTLLVLLCAATAQARVLTASPNATVTSTATSTSSSAIPSTTAIVIPGNCDQNTLQFCCPLVAPYPGEDSVDFATACEFFFFPMEMVVKRRGT